MASYAGIRRLLDNLHLEICRLFRMCQTWAEDVSNLLDLNIRDDHIHPCSLRQEHLALQPYLAFNYDAFKGYNTNLASPL